MMYTTREIAEKLYRYALLIQAEQNKAAAIERIVGDGDTRSRRLEDEAEEVTAMANALYEMKGKVHA